MPQAGVTAAAATASVQKSRGSIGRIGGFCAANAVWLLVSFAYLTVFPYYASINNPNENVRVFATRAIVEFRELSINRASVGWGYVNDKAVVGRKLYSSKAPGTSFLGVPVYAAQVFMARALHLGTPSRAAITLGLRLFTVALPMCVFLFFFGRWVLRLTESPAARDLLLVGVGLGTMLYPYGVIFVGHAQAAALAFSSFMLLCPPGGEPASRARLAWAGALAGLAVLFEYQVMFVAVALAVYAVLRYRRQALAFVAGAAPTALLFGVYHAALFGRPWELPFGHLENPEFASLHNKAQLFGMRAPSPGALVAVLFSVSLGLFVFSPFLLVGAGAAVAGLFRGPRRESAIILASTAAMVGFLACVP
ncbi:MAG TPA: hypothetical protein VMU50_19835, partial [Polyangia bacterium]|nr:hypothetical protein [Polyangia bacterium]